MASLQNEGPKKWRLLFMDLNGTGERRQIRFTNTKKYATTLYNVVERLIEARTLNGSIDPADAGWLANLPDKVFAKLVKHGLVNPRVIEEPKPEPKAGPTLESFLIDHVEHGRTSQGNPAAQSTIAKWVGTQRFLVGVFGANKPLDKLTAEDAHQFRVWLDTRRIKQKTAGRRGQPMAENAKRKHIANCKMFFNAAKRRGLIENNPFEAQVSGSQANRSRDHYITPEDAAKILLAAPDAQWRLMFGLWRLAGLRKMEIFSLTWGDVKRDAGKLLVRSLKTEHIAGCDIRYVPIRDVGQYLDDAFQAALPSGKQSLPAEQPIITRFSASNSNLDKPFRKIVEAAGMVPWPKLFQHLRASCETQWLKQGERADLVANWIGHSVKVQNNNYVQQTDDDITSFNAKTPFGFHDEKKATKKATDDAQNATKRHERTNQRDFKNPMKTLLTSVFSTQTMKTTCPGRDSNPHAPIGTLDFKSNASAIPPPGLCCVAAPMSDTASGLAEVTEICPLWKLYPESL